MTVPMAILESPTSTMAVLLVNTNRQSFAQQGEGSTVHFPLVKVLQACFTDGVHPILIGLITMVMSVARLTRPRCSLLRVSCLRVCELSLF
jgi:hypothetical protein